MITETQQYKDLIETREAIRRHRQNVVNDISAPAWTALDHAQTHIEKQLTELTRSAFQDEA